MPITPYLDGIWFDPETKRVTGVAFEMARAAISHLDCSDPVDAILARKIIALAKDGERNPDLLCEEALTSLQLRKLSAAGNGASLSDLLEVLVHTAIDLTGGRARAAFYRANAKGSELHHLTGMPQAYARHVDGFAISGQSLACGLAAFTRQPIITPDVIAEPRGLRLRQKLKPAHPRHVDVGQDQDKRTVACISDALKCHGSGLCKFYREPVSAEIATELLAK